MRLTVRLKTASLVVTLLGLIGGALLLSLTRAELGELLGDATAIADRRQLAAKIADLRWASSRRAAVLRALRRLWPGWLFARLWPWRAKPKRE